MGHGQRTGLVDFDHACFGRPPPRVWASTRFFHVSACTSRLERSHDPHDTKMSKAYLIGRVLEDGRERRLLRDRKPACACVRVRVRTCVRRRARACAHRSRATAAPPMLGTSTMSADARPRITHDPHRAATGDGAQRRRRSSMRRRRRRRRRQQHKTLTHTRYGSFGSDVSVTLNVTFDLRAAGAARRCVVVVRRRRSMRKPFDAARTACQQSTRTRTRTL